MAHLAAMHAKKEGEHKKEGGAIISSIVFGGLDGIVTTFAILVAAAAQNLQISVLLILTFGNVVGDAIGMGVGDWLSTLSEQGLQKTERDRERKEMETHLEEEKLEMVLIYQEKGLSREDSEELVELLMENPEGFLNVMCVYELGILGEVEDSWKTPLKNGIVTFISFMICSAIPMLAYIFCFKYDQNAGLDYLFWISIALFAVTLFTLGAVKGVITNTRWWLSGLVTLLQGTITTVVAYFVSYGFENISI